MKERKNYWMIDGCDEKFETLRDAKNHTTFWTPKELEQYEGAAVMHYKNDNIIAICTLHARNGKPMFSQVCRVTPNHVW